VFREAVIFPEGYTHAAISHDSRRKRGVPYTVRPEAPMDTLMESWPRRHRITVDEYHRMADVGLLAPDARVELIDGEIIEMAPIGRNHMSVVDQLTRLFVLATRDKAIVRIQGSVRLSQMSEPEPDLLLLQPRPDFYRGESATGEDTLLIIEVSDTSLRYDREIKVPLYSRHGAPEVWIVDLQNARLLVYSDPVDGKFRGHRVVERPGRMGVSALADVEVDLSGLFPD
jgi:Uma2 family endonuclease